MLHVWIIYLHQVKNGHIQGEMWVNIIPYVEPLGNRRLVFQKGAIFFVVSCSFDTGHGLPQTCFPYAVTERQNHPFCWKTWPMVWNLKSLDIQHDIHRKKTWWIYAMGRIKKTLLYLQYDVLNDAPRLRECISDVIGILTFISYVLFFWGGWGFCKWGVWKSREKNPWSSPFPIIFYDSRKSIPWTNPSETLSLL